MTVQTGRETNYQNQLQFLSRKLIEKYALQDCTDVTLKPNATLRTLAMGNEKSWARIMTKCPQASQETCVRNSLPPKMP